MTLRALIVDDEPLARRAIRQLLDRHDDVSVVGECVDGVDAQEVLAHRVVDVVFLDVRMPALSGLELARAIAGPPLVVLVTAHEEHAAAAFDAGAAEYVLKPVTATRLDAALSRVRTRLADAAAAARFRALPGTGDWVDRLVVRIGSRDLVIAIEEVELLEADDVHVRIHARGRRYQMRQSLDALAALLDPSRFARVHRSYVVPISRIAAVRRRRGGAAELELHTGTRVPVSRRRRGVLDRLGASEARG